MKYADLKVGQTYAVIPSWDYSSSEKKDPNTVKRNHVAKSELVSLDKYEYGVYRASSADDPNFKPAPKGSRSVGYLVKSNDWNTGANPVEVYWLARPQDIVAKYSDLEVRWIERERIEKEQELKMKQEREERERKERALQERQNALKDSCMNGIKLILGDRANSVKAEITNRRTIDGNYEPKAVFEFDAITMQIFIEKVLEAQEAVQ